jgi:hypothetical protein
MSADQATLTITITYSAISYTRVFALAKSRGGYEILASDPVSNLFQGRVYFNTSTNKLRRYTGSAWTYSVDTDDFDAQITDAQIAGMAAAKLTTQITTTNISDNAITTAKIGAGQVVANSIAAYAITASRMVLQNNDDVFPDTSITDPVYHSGGALTAFTGTFGGASHADGVANQPRRSFSVSGTLHYYATSPITVEAGATYRVKLRLYKPAGTTGHYCSFLHLPGAALVLPGAIGNNPNEAGWPGLPLASYAADTWHVLTTTVVASNAYNYIQMYHTHNLAGGPLYAQWEITRAASADLVVDGAITAAKIDTNAVTADKILAGAVTAGKISVTDLAAINANMGTITAGTLQVGSGGVTIQSAGSGQRIVITNSRIEVYDSTPTLRVRIGIW